MKVENPMSPGQQAKAEQSKAHGNRAINENRFQEATDHYYEAIKIQPNYAVYSANRSAALYMMARYTEAQLC